MRTWWIAVGRCAVLVCAALLLMPGPATAEQPAGSTPNEIARFLAGLPPAEGSALAARSGERTWRRHAAAMDSAWTRIEARQLSRIRAWSASELTLPSEVLYYFFSGPDFLHADAFFPAAKTYVLAALEPAGPLPSLGRHGDKAMAQGLAQLRGSLNSVLNFSFFRTREMRTTLGANTFSGTLPILYIFLARTGKTIEEVSFHDINEDGTIVDAGAGLPKIAASVVRIAFKDAEGTARTLYYVRTDLSNGGWRRSGFKTFAEKLGPADGLIKSASYLLHEPVFSDVRSFLLARTKRLLQDDSGIPVSFFKTDEWHLRPYGRYLGPIALFPANYQPGLRDIFRTSKAPAIDFGIGYRFRPNESNILVADKLSVRAAR